MPEYPPLKHMPPPPCLVNQHEITFTKKEGCTLSTCLCVTLAVIFVTLGAAAGIYYGIQFLEGQRSIERVYKGSFTVLEGDRFSENLANSLTDDFLMKAEYYRAKLDQLFNTSAYQSGFKKVEVIAFNKRQHRELTVHFNVHFALNRKSVDAGDLYFVFTDEVLRSKLGIFDGLKIDPESIIVQERRLMADPLAESWTPKRQYPGYLAGLTTQQPAVIPPRLCEPLSIDHCRGLPYNLTSYPNAVGHNGPKEVYRDLVAYRQLVDSECYPLAAEFVCQLLQPECVDDEMLLPCRDFCEEFWSACRKLLPKSLSGKIDCSNYPQYDGNGSCRNKPGCANELKARGKTVRVCDGVVDCPDFSDETSCDRCGPGLLHCGDRQCIDITQRCDSRLDCTNGADEQNCLTLASNSETVSTSPLLHPHQGYLMANEKGQYKKICMDDFNSTLPLFRRDVILKNLATTACSILNLGPPSRMELHRDGNSSDSYLQLLDPQSPGLRFSSAHCQTKLVVYLQCSLQECGKSSATPPQNATAMYTSKPGRHGDWPWHVMLLQDNKHVCDGTLISNKWVLTSSSCFRGPDNHNWAVRLGSVRKMSASPFDVYLRAIQIIHSPMVNAQLSLVRLETEVEESHYVRPSCLPAPNQRTSVGETCVTLGYDLKGDQMEQLNLEIVTFTACYNSSLPGTGSTICGRQQESSHNSICMHESLPGRQLMCWRGDRWYLFGVGSSMSMCNDRPVPQHFHTISSHLQWISTVMGIKKPS